jgi:hypothetical protein
MAFLLLKTAPKIPKLVDLQNLTVLTDHLEKKMLTNISKNMVTSKDGLEMHANPLILIINK